MQPEDEVYPITHAEPQLEEEKKDASEQQEGESPGLSSNRQIKVLIVDDNIFSSFVLQRMIQQFKIESETVLDGT